MKVSGGRIEIAARATATSFRAGERFREKIQRLNHVIVTKMINDDVATPTFCSRSADRNEVSFLFARRN